MNRDRRSEQLQAELHILENEAVFARRKAEGTLTIEDKHALRALRQEYREKYRAEPPNGVQVGAIGAKGDV